MWEGGREGCRSQQHTDMAHGGSARVTVTLVVTTKLRSQLMPAQGRAVVQAALDGDVCPFFSHLAPALLQCPWAGDRVVSGGCNVKTGAGRISTPICTNQAGQQVLWCE
jgi:hypothetical protein